MIETSMNEIFSDRTEISGYRIYAIFDKQNRCLYVGQTKSLKSRVRRHRYDKKSELQEHLVKGEDYRVLIYDCDDVEHIALKKKPDSALRSFSDDRKWAHAAEWFMCDELRPYINRRKTYKPYIDGAIKLAMYGDWDRDTAYKEAVQVLRDWNITSTRF